MPPVPTTAPTTTTTTTTAPAPDALKIIACTNIVYGDFRAPTSPGAAGTNGNGKDPAGGVVLLSVISLHCDGRILADGVGTGSGGSIYVQFTTFGNETNATFTGTGTFSASSLPIPGGTDNLGGSGGRISAVDFASEPNYEELPQLVALGSMFAAPGTIFLRQLPLYQPATFPMFLGQSPAPVTGPHSILSITGPQEAPLRLPLYPTTLPAGNYGQIDDLLIFNALFMLAPTATLDVTGTCSIIQSSVSFTGVSCASFATSPGSSTTPITSTMPSTSPSTSTTTSTQKIDPSTLISIIIASSFGFLVLLAFALLGIWFCRRRNRKKNRKSGYAPLINAPAFDYMTYSGSGEKPSASINAGPGIQINSSSGKSVPFSTYAAGSRGSTADLFPSHNSHSHSHSHSHGTHRNYMKLEALSGENLDTALSG